MCDILTLGVINLNRLREIRRRVGKTQQQVGDYLSVSRSTVTKWETDIHFPDHETLVKLAAFYGTTVDDLLGLEKYSPVLTGEEVLILNDFRRLNSAGQAAALGVVHAYTLMEEYAKKDMQEAACQ